MLGYSTFYICTYTRQSLGSLKADSSKGQMEILKNVNLRKHVNDSGKIYIREDW